MGLGPAGNGLPTPAMRCATHWRRTRTCACSSVGLLRSGDAVLRHRIHARPSGLPPILAARITRHYYQAGHMMYIDVDELAALRRDVAAFIAEALK